MINRSCIDFSFRVYKSYQCIKRIYLANRTSRKVELRKKKVESEETQTSEIRTDENDSIIGKVQMVESPGKMESQKLVIFCDPKHPLHFLESFFCLTKPYINVLVSTHIHSTVQKIPKDLQTFCSNYRNTDQNVHINLTIIWKEIGVDPIMRLTGMHKIRGTINIARYLNRLIEIHYPHVLQYESRGALYANQIDSYLEHIHSMLHTNAGRYHQRSARKSRYVMGDSISIVDIILQSFEKCKLSKM